ncbi:putative zinc-binding peptidase [Terrarubrum flagellatum]|uniref:zinc-binding metallopeptidase family protein n=1 Tax=Terrirubrum flagellatum TaxID=2895980 RepID=UPI00314518BF
MRLFQCHACGNAIHFDNRACQRCGRRLGFIPALGVLTALEPADDDQSFVSPRALGRVFRFCANAEYEACNWLCPADDPIGFCAACRHNGVIPDVSDHQRLQEWRLIEMAKRRLFYSLLRWGLPLRTRQEDPEHGLIFEFLADDIYSGAPKVMTGHESGRITIALAEASDVERERRRVQMREPYRTLLGHFRHEIAHYYWDILVSDGGPIEECRALFGDERADYQAALASYYQAGAPANWPDQFVSAYASVHPWEDFAETWAHYFHLVDGLETGASFGIQIAPRGALAEELSARLDFDPYRASDGDQLVEAWLPFTIALNSINRSIGLSDVYPFILSPAAIEKLKFIHALIATTRDRQSVLPRVGGSTTAPAT